MGEVKAAGGADKNRGNAEQLRRYWTHGEGAAKIGWGTPGDFKRCEAALTPHLGARAAGYCNLRHQDAVGAPPGKGHKALKGGDVRTDTTNPEPDGVMVALYPDHDSVMSVSSMLGNAALGVALSEMHVTLAYLGKLADLADPDGLVALIMDIAAETPEFTGQIGGLGRFTIPGDEGDAFYASIDVPDLSDFRTGLVGAMADEGFATRADHGFTPHMTLAYVAEDQPTPVARLERAFPVVFPFLSVAVGGDVYDFPLPTLAELGAAAA